MVWIAWIQAWRIDIFFNNCKPLILFMNPPILSCNRPKRQECHNTINKSKVRNSCISFFFLVVLHPPFFHRNQKSNSNRAPSFLISVEIRNPKKKQTWSLLLLLSVHGGVSWRAVPPTLMVWIGRVRARKSHVSFRRYIPSILLTSIPNLSCCASYEEENLRAWIICRQPTPNSCDLRFCCRCWLIWRKKKKRW